MHFVSGVDMIHEAALRAEEDPDRLSFIHAVRVIRRKLPAAVAVPPQHRAAFHDAVLREILQERVAAPVSDPTPPTFNLSDVISIVSEQYWG
jgi:hypothetical protein